MLFKKSEYMLTQGVALLTLVTTLYAWNAWDHDPPFGDKQRLAFYDSGFPMEARVIKSIYKPLGQENTYLYRQIRVHVMLFSKLSFVFYLTLMASQAQIRIK